MSLFAFILVYILVGRTTRNHFLGLCPFSKAILEFSRNRLQISHATRARGTTTLGFECPIVLAHFGTGISARRARFLLNVKGNLATSTTRCVRLVVSLTK
jgi:hypothetical protein